MNSYARKIINVYLDYGFELEKEYRDDNVIVFGMTGGYFNNVDIVSCSLGSNFERARTDYEQAGYSVTTREFRSYEKVESDLFAGFFHIKRNKERFDKEYGKFSRAVVGMYGEGAEYKYLSSPYFINERVGDRDVVSEINDRLEEEKPILFLVEAAAGFGKTCTAYEVAKLINSRSVKVPFLAELSRNRQARIFKHILLDEIDRVFPSLSSKLVEREIKSGRVVTVLDGFDELLRDGDADADFEGKEPMFETIGHYLRGKAKLVLTTRKTVLFDGGSFFDWVDENSENFELVRLRLGEPKISDWLEKERYKKLRDMVGDELDNISNPVLLSYLRCLKDSLFDEFCKKPSGLVESYFDFMLEREKKRQDLSLEVDEQHQILDAIALDMVELDYSSEERDYFVDLILENCAGLIEGARERYPLESRPTKEEVANKLASHAFLDRSSRDPNYIGFINEFVFGNYIGRNIISGREWAYDKWSFLDAAITSYRHRDSEQRERLFLSLNEVKPFLQVSHQITIDLELKSKITIDILDEQVESIVFDGVTLGDTDIRGATFVDCTFSKCKFNFANIEDVTFLSCSFYSSEMMEEGIENPVHFINSIDDNGLVAKVKAIMDSRNEASCLSDMEKLASAEKVVLERFWPVGKDAVTYKHRPIRGICNNYGGHTPVQLYNAIESLKRKEILVEPKSASFVEINFNKMVEIKDALGRA